MGARSRPHLRPVATALLIPVMLSLLLAACGPPPPDSIGLGEHRGQISPLQQLTFHYQGQAGERLNVASNRGHGNDYILDNYVGHQVYARVIGPDGEPAPRDVYRSGLFWETYDLPVTGRYRIVLTYGDWSWDDLSAVPYTLWLSNDEHRGTAELGPLEAGIPGQRFIYDYEGQAGEHLNASGVEVFDPDGVRLPVGTPNDPPRRSGQVTLPVDGTYRLEALHWSPRISHDVDAGMIELGSHAMGGLVRRQHVDFHYAGTAGEELFTADRSFELAVYDSAGTRLYPTNYLNRQRRSPRFVLPADGVYTFSLTVNDEGEDVELVVSRALDAGALALGDNPAPPRLAGQPVRFTYQADSSEVLLLNTDLPLDERILVQVLRPDGSSVSRTRVTLDGIEWQRFGLDAAGTYTVEYWSDAAPAPFTVSAMLQP